MSNGGWESRLTELEVITKERWDNHDNRSDEQWTHIRSMLHDLTSRMNCEVHVTRINSMCNKVNWLYGILSGTFIAVIVFELCK